MYYRMPAEWEAQGFVQLTWPHADTDWNRCGLLAEAQETFRNIARAVLRHEDLLVVGKKPLGLESDLQCCCSVDIPSDDTWARDHAFVSLVSDDGGAPLLLDFRFNAWGGKFPHARDNAINRALATHIGGIYEDDLDFVLEGGSIESDGRGTIFTTTRCLTAPGRNNMGRDALERELLRRLRAKRIVWIDHGAIAGDDTDGHIDMLVRIAPGDTLLYYMPQSPADPMYAELAAMEEELRGLRTMEGKPYRLIPLTAPDATLRGKPASYANFLVVNGAVLVPAYGDAAHDALAAATIADAYGRAAEQIDCRALIEQGGSLHCSTMQYYNRLSI